MDDGRIQDWRDGTVRTALRTRLGMEWTAILAYLQPFLSLAVWLLSQQSQTDLVMWLTDAGIYKVSVGLYFRV